MSLDKAIEHGKEKRKPYRGSKAWDYSCRNHGSCSYCVEQRTHNRNALVEITKLEIKEYICFGGDETEIEEEE